MKETVGIAELPGRVADAAFDGDLETVLNASAGWLRRFTRSPYALVATVEDGIVKRIVQTGTAPESVSQLPNIPLGRGQMYVDDAGVTHSVLEHEQPPTHGQPVVGYFFGVPLYFAGRLVGVIYIARSSDYGKFNRRELMCAHAFAGRLATAIELSRAVGTVGVPHLDELAQFSSGINEFKRFLPFETSRLDRVLSISAQEFSEHYAIDAAHVYLPAPDEILMPSNRWIQSKDDKLKHFREATSRSAFMPGFGLPGRIAQQTEPSWIPDVSADGNFPRVNDALAAGVRSACAFPVRVNGNVAAIVECFFTRRVEGEVGWLRQVERVVEENSGLT